MGEQVKLVPVKITDTHTYMLPVGGNIEWGTHKYLVLENGNTKPNEYWQIQFMGDDEVEQIWKPRPGTIEFYHPQDTRPCAREMYFYHPDGTRSLVGRYELVK